LPIVSQFTGNQTNDLNNFFWTSCVIQSFISSTIYLYEQYILLFLIVFSIFDSISVTLVY
jgi:archaellum biogenesis protein FlaJ (TadC family)